MSDDLLSDPDSLYRALTVYFLSNADRQLVRSKVDHRLTDYFNVCTTLLRRGLPVDVFISEWVVGCAVQLLIWLYITMVSKYIGFSLVIYPPQLCYKIGSINFIPILRISQNILRNEIREHVTLWEGGM
jgi:hypothetical protein